VLATPRNPRSPSISVEPACKDLRDQLRNRYPVPEPLKEARLQAGLTQVQAAQALEQPQSFLSKCESGERRVHFVELQTLARLYGVPIGYFEQAKPEKR